MLPANGRGPGIKFAVHGLILDAKAEHLETHAAPDGQTLRAEIHAGDFGGYWLSSTNLSFVIALTAYAVEVAITAKNIGKEIEPIAIGWHPYFVIPSGDRSQARLHVPAAMVAVANDAIPTGRLVRSKERSTIINRPVEFPSTTIHSIPTFPTSGGPMERSMPEWSILRSSTGFVSKAYRLKSRQSKFFTQRQVIRSRRGPVQLHGSVWQGMERDKHRHGVASSPSIRDLEGPAGVIHTRVKLIYLRLESHG